MLSSLSGLWSTISRAVSTFVDHLLRGYFPVPGVLPLAFLGLIALLLLLYYVRRNKAIGPLHAPVRPGRRRR
jgi:hypothetical protein